MKDLKVWMRAGDQDDYHPFDSPEEAAEDLAPILGRYAGNISVQWYQGPALTGVNIVGTGFVGDNGVSLFWGDDDAQLYARLDDLEIGAFANTLISAVGEYA